MEEFQRYLKIGGSEQHYFLYPLIFQEYIYALAHDHDLNRAHLLENAGYDNKYSLLVVKRLIFRMYKQNPFVFSVKHSNQNTFWVRNKSFDSQKISEGFSVIVEIPFSLPFFSFLEKNGRFKSRNLRSIHSVFPFLEDKFSHLNDVLVYRIPYPAHLEILVQILRYWVKDVPFLHLLRFFLDDCPHWTSSFSPKKVGVFFSKRKQRFFFFLYNSYLCEYESILVFLCNQSSRLQSTAFGAFVERIYLYEKKELLAEVFAIDFQVNLWLFQDPLMHYVRYQGKSLFASKGSFLFMHKWKDYLIGFWQWHFFQYFRPVRVYINHLSKHSLDLLGYLSSVRLTPLRIRSQTLEYSYLIDNAVQKFDTLVPILPMIASLFKAQFCNVVGYPITKVVWADLSDFEIISRFRRICRKLSHYHSGSSQKKTLYQIKYILRLSCARTLARKHKSTVRAFLKRSGSQFLEDFFTAEEQVLFLTFPTAPSSLQRLYRRRVWYLDIIRMNDLVNHE
nr:maturase K [Valerianella locusta]UUL71479.1 maturase K [Valerianella locusta]